MNVTPPIMHLESADLIRRLRELEEAYQFKHALVQESAYKSLLHADRRALHRACAEALEKAYPDQLDENAALLVQHYSEAGDDAKTFEYARRAGDAAMRLHAIPEALMHYDKAALLAARLPLSAAEFRHIHLQRARALEVMGQYPDAVESYRTLVELARQRSDPELEMRGLLSLATVHTFPNTVQNIPLAQTLNEEALELARTLRDEEAEARALWNKQQLAYFTGHAADAVVYSKQALAIAERLDLKELRAYILNDISRSLTSVENVPAALAALEESRNIWTEIHNLPMLADNLSTTSETAHLGGEIEMATAFAQRAQELSREIHNLWNLTYSSGMLLQLYSLTGESAKALALSDHLDTLAQESGFFLAAVLAGFERAILWGRLGQPQRGLELLETFPPNGATRFMEAWRLGAIAKQHILSGDLAAARETLTSAQQVENSDDLSTFGPLFITVDTAELAMHDGDYERAAEITQQLAARLDKAKIRFFLPEILYTQGLAYMGMEEPARAAHALEQAEQVARYMRARFALWEILAARAELAEQTGDRAGADSLRHEARELLLRLAADAPAEGRASFLAQPRVRTLLEP